MKHLQGNFYIEHARDRVRIIHNKDGEVSAALLTRAEFASAVAYAYGGDEPAAQIMVRSAPNDFDAMRTAQGMENAGATVIGISYNGQHQPYGALEPSSKFVVWARVPAGVHIDNVDAAISKQLDE